MVRGSRSEGTYGCKGGGARSFELALPSLRVALIGGGATLRVRSILDALWVALIRGSSVLRGAVSIRVFFGVGAFK